MFIMHTRRIIYAYSLVAFDHVRWSRVFCFPDTINFHNVVEIEYSAMPAQHMKAPKQAQEDTSPAKIDVTSKSPVGDISVVTLIRTDTTLDHSQKAEKVAALLSTVAVNLLLEVKKRSKFSSPTENNKTTQPTQTNQARVS